MSKVISNRERATLEGFGFSTVKRTRELRRARDLQRKRSNRERGNREREALQR